MGCHITASEMLPCKRRLQHDPLQRQVAAAPVDAGAVAARRFGSFDTVAQSGVLDRKIDDGHIGLVQPTMLKTES
jgi:hypothetical protein